MKKLPEDLLARIISLSHDGGKADIGNAIKELVAVVKETQDAAEKILTAAENIQALASSEKDAAKINGEITAIFEACNFQDITGQRIKNVKAALEIISSAMSGILPKNATHPKTAKAKTMAQMTDSDLMNGPQLNANKPSQDDVDKLFDNA